LPSFKKSTPLSVAIDASKEELQARAGARELLLNAAEPLFGERGIEAVSLREIAAAAGQKNNSAVSYHFRDKQGLVDALIADRIAKVEQRRQLLIKKVGDLSSCDATALLQMLWQPLLDIDADRSAHYCIQFQLAYQVQQAGSGHPIFTNPAGHPASGKILTALQTRFRQLSPAQFQYRLGLVAMMFWVAVAAHDHVLTSTNQRWSSRFSLEEIIKLAVAALAAPH
jgi:AcrR family transcriptional regulator